MSFALSVTQPAPACTEHELVAAVRQGSDQAFEELYARYRPRIASYIYGMVGDHARAEDLVQEVFISALRRLRETDQAIAFKPWIYEIAKNSCIDEFRRTRRVREVPLGAETDADEGGEVEAVQSFATTDGELETKQSLEDLRGAFYGLSETHHKIIVMRELAGLSYAEISQRLDMSQAMVESNLFRARRRLTEEYNELISGRRCQRVQTIIGVDDPALLRKLGIRQRRLLARHLAHCQPCRREARMAGLDESFFKTPTVIGKIAALLPFPWLRWHRSGGDEDTPAASGSSHGFSALSTVQNAARWFDPSGPSTGLGRAATALAALAVAAVGGGVATTVAGHPSHPAPRLSTAAASVRSTASTTTATHTYKAVSARSVPAAAHARIMSAGHHASRLGSAAGGGRAGSAGGSGKTGKGTKSSTGGHGGGGGSGSSSSAGSTSSGGSGGSGSSGASGPSGSTSHSTSSTRSGPKLPVVSEPHSVTVGGVTVTTPTVSVPTVPLPKVPVPKVQLPKVEVPTVSVPSPTKVVKKILGG